MTKLWVSAAVTVLVAVLVVPLGSVPASADPGTTTYVTAFSDQWDEVGRGHDWLMRGTEHVTVRRSAGGNELQITARTGGQDDGEMYLDFGLASGETLTAGVYPVTADHSTDARMNISESLLDKSTIEQCSSPITGSFEVKDILADYSRFTITYEQHCLGQAEAIFGEIRYQEPDDDPELLVAPTHVEWPVAYRDVPAHVVPVTLINTGTAPVQVSEAAITDGTSEFSIKDSSCGTLLAGDSCVVDVSYVARLGAAHRGQLSIQDSTSAGSHVVPLAAGLIPGDTSWQVHSQEQDYVGDGRDYSISPDQTPMWATGNPNTVYLSTGTDWVASFAAPPGEVLRPGITYTGVMRTPFPDAGHPGLAVSNSGSGCNEVTGSFHLRELTFDHGLVHSFAATFVQHCDGKPPALVGSIAWHASAPADAVPTPTKLTPRLSLLQNPPVLEGDRARVAGKIWRGLDFEVLPGHRVVVHSRPHTGGPWRVVGSTTTTSEGTYSLRYVVRRNTDYIARFAGDRDHTPASSRVMIVRAKWRVTLDHAGHAPRGRARLECSVLHGHRGQLVDVQAKNSKDRWHKIGSVRLNSHGTKVFTVKRPARGVSGFRVVARAGDGRVPGPSGSVTVHQR